jgi:capsule polysaccharide export protein KpsC/LpsZ
MNNFNKQKPMPKINIPKTPRQLFLKKAGDVNQSQQQPQIHLDELKPIKTVKYIDELYSSTFLDDYFK